MLLKLHTSDATTADPGLVLQAVLHLRCIKNRTSPNSPSAIPSLYVVLCCRAMLQKIPAGHLHTNCRVVGVELGDPGSAIIELESGERICGHLVIAADG